MKVLGPNDHTCPSCGASPLVRGRIATITVEQAKVMGMDPEGADVQNWNALATTHDGVLCQSCRWDGFAESSDPGIRVGRQRMRVTSFTCSDCNLTFDRLEELTEHYANVHPHIEGHQLRAEDPETGRVACECGEWFNSKSELEVHMRGIQQQIIDRRSQTEEGQ